MTRVFMYSGSGINIIYTETLKVMNAPIKKSEAVRERVPWDRTQKSSTLSRNNST